MRPLERPDAPVSLASIGTNTGALASAAWCAARDLLPGAPRWSVEIVLEATDARFSVEIFAQEWGFAFRRSSGLSWIRVTDMPFVHGRDDFSLLHRTPRLEHIATLIAALEEEHGIVFDRDAVEVKSDVGGEEQIAAWIRG